MEGCEERPQVIGSSRHGGLAGPGNGSGYVGRIGKGDGPRYYHVELSGKAAAKASAKRFGFGQTDEGSITNVFLIATLQA